MKNLCSLSRNLIHVSFYLSDLSLCYMLLTKSVNLVAILTQLSTPSNASNAADFGHLLKHLQNVENLKKRVTDEVEISKRRKTSYSLEADIRETLARGEGVPGTSKKVVKRKKANKAGSEVESDWEEVKGRLSLDDLHSRETNPSLCCLYCKVFRVF